MKGPRIGFLLVLLSTALLVVATGTVTFSASRILGRIAEDEASGSARVAAADAVDDVARELHAAATAASVLAGRPTLRRLIAAGDAPGLVRFLEKFRTTSGLARCEVVGSRPAERTVEIGVDGEALLSAGAPVAEREGSWVRVASAYRPPPSVRLRGRDELDRAPFGPRTALRDAVVGGGSAASAKIVEQGVFVAVAPLRSAGEIVGVVEAETPIAAAIAVRDRWVRDVRAIALGVLVLTVAGSIVLGRALARPIEDLTRTARRIGLGDLESPVSATGPGETGVLARSMEEMRLRLLETTRELGRRRAESEAILGGIVEGVFAVDDARTIRYLNPRAAEMLGVRTEDALGRFCGDVLRSLGPDGTRPCDERCPIVAARAGASARAVEQVASAGGGRRTAVLTSAPPAEGRQIQLLRDETEAETTRRLRDTVVANISHEFKTPLAAQLASIEMLRDRLDELAPAEARDLVLSLERGALRLTRLIDNLLESVRLEAGEDAIRRNPVALDEIVEEAVESTRPLFDQREQRVEVELPHPLPEIVGDAPRLVQVLVNLLANANKFAPPGSTVRVGGERTPDGVTLFVADEGPGLPPGDDDAVFGRFVRRAGEEPEQSGMGLGLWIARSIVERHGGRIRASRAERGAKIVVALPVREPS